LYVRDRFPIGYDTLANTRDLRQYVSPRTRRAWGGQVEPRPSDIFAPLDTFERRHNGSGDAAEVAEMLQTLGFSSLDELVSKTIPANIRLQNDLNLVRPWRPRGAIMQQPTAS